MHIATLVIILLACIVPLAISAILLHKYCLKISRLHLVSAWNGEFLR
jgi:hypothetical protein